MMWDMLLRDQDQDIIDTTKEQNDVIFVISFEEALVIWTFLHCVDFVPDPDDKFCTVSTISV